MLKKYLILGWLMLPASLALAQAGDIPRRTDGTPDLNGIWQSLNNANWNLQGQVAQQGAVESLGAIGAVTPGLGVVEGEEIPYLPAAIAQKLQNFSNRRTQDPEAKCFMPGIPRATYLPQPFQIFQTDDDVMMVYQFAGAVRNVFMSNPIAAPIDSWMGWSNGHWDGDTLVIEVTGLNPNWLDRAGNYYTATASITERYTPLSQYHLQYDVTIEDPAVYAEPWSISMPLYRRVEDNARLLEFKCPEFAEEIMYSHLTRENYLRAAGIDVEALAEEEEDQDE